jgi:hypothetical protein
LLHPARWFESVESVLSLKLNGQKKNGISCQPVEKMQPDEKMAFLSRMFRLSKTWPDRFPKESPFFFQPAHRWATESEETPTTQSKSQGERPTQR